MEKYSLQLPTYAGAEMSVKINGLESIKKVFQCFHKFEDILGNAGPPDSVTRDSFSKVDPPPSQLFHYNEEPPSTYLCR
jgi:hypothetical protein